MPICQQRALVLGLRSPLGGLGLERRTSFEVHAEDTIGVGSIVSEEGTIEGGKGTYLIDLEDKGRLISAGFHKTYMTVH